MFNFSRFGSMILLLTLASPTVAAELLGRVTQGGKPQANQTVTLRNNDAKAQPLTNNTDAAGNFVFSGVAPGEYTLKCNGKDRPVTIGAGGNRSDCKD